MEDEGTPTAFFLDYGDGWLHVPRGWVFGQRPWLLNQGQVHDQRSDGSPLPHGTRAHVTFGESPHPKGQPQFIDEIVAGCKRNGHGGLALAPTRAGKTLCSLEAACRLGRSTLILVDNVELMKQWAANIREHLKVGCGVIREKEFDVSQPFTVATVQTLARRNLPESVRKMWGTVIVDECNSAPCAMLWTALTRLHNRYLIGLTATPDRKDGLGHAIGWIIGPVVASLHRRLEADVHWLPMLWTADRGLRSHPSPVDADKKVMDDVSRVNRIALEAVRGVKAEPNGRRVLVMATLVEHCTRIADAIRKHGVGVDLFVGGATLDSLTEPVQVATYKKASKGLDFDPPHTLFIPAGPVSDIRQAVGRALQPQVPHKTIILDPVDMQPKLRKWAYNRSRFYEKQGFIFRNQLPGRVA